MSYKLPVMAFLLFLTLAGCEEPKTYDLLIKGGTIYDGSGSPGIIGDLAINGDTIAAVGNIGRAVGLREIDATGLAVSPGFINMMSWAPEDLLVDGRAQSDIYQGVTLEVMGEGSSMGPLTPEMKEWYGQEARGRYEVRWNTLGEYLAYLEEKGVSPNVASFVGATTIRTHEIGYEDRAPTGEELTRMKQLVREAMEEGAMGVASALIYAPAFFADTEELTELAKVAAEYDGLYATHMRSEGNRLLEAIDETLEIADQAGIRAEIYHLKAAGKSNWSKLDQAIAKIDSARKAGLPITADMYTYTAGATGLDATMPPWVQEGGYVTWVSRLKRPAIRKRLIKEMNTDAQDWENFFFASGSPENIILVGFRNDSLRKYTGKTLAEVARMRGSSPEETAMDLVIQDGSRVGTIYFLMSEENVRKEIALPWMSFCSDAGAPSAEGEFLNSNPHPRAYGSFVRVLGKYVRDEKVITMEEAVRKLAALPAENLRIVKRGKLISGYFADVVVFDPDSVQDHATFEKPHQYASGVHYVWVNGVLVLEDGKHTGATPGRFVKGPGYRPEP